MQLTELPYMIRATPTHSRRRHTDITLHHLVTVTDSRHLVTVTDFRLRATVTPSLPQATITHFREAASISQLNTLTLLLHRKIKVEYENRTR